MEFVGDTRVVLRCIVSVSFELVRVFSHAGELLDVVRSVVLVGD